MSIESEITRINNEVSTQTNLITQIASALSGKTGGNSDVALPDTITAGDTPVMLFAEEVDGVYSSTLSASGAILTVPRDGTYRFKYMGVRWSTSGTYQLALYKNDVQLSETLTSFSSSRYGLFCSFDVECSAGDKIEVWGRSRGSSYGVCTYYLAACINWDNGF